MFIYRLILSLVAPLVILARLGAVLRGREPLALLAERFGRFPDLGPMIWLHGASNGELQSARAVIAALRRARPDLAVLVTCNNPTARAMVADWRLNGVTARLAPIDLRWLTRAALAGRDLRLMVALEKEFWPNRMAVLAARGVPVAVIGAQISARGAAAWARWPRLVARVFAPVRLVVPQDATAAARFAGLGLNPARIATPVDLKSMAVADRSPLPADLVAAMGNRGDVILAASTHEGEEAPILAAFAALRAKRPTARLVLAPRHPRRADQVAQLVRAAGFDAGRRSLGQLPEGPVYLVDRLGEMGIWYRLAGTVFVGGSLVERGGHTPYEPAVHGCAIIHGPATSNFAVAYARLDAAKAAVAITDAAPDAFAAALARAMDDVTLAGRGAATLAGAEAGGLALALADLALPAHGV